MVTRYLIAAAACALATLPARSADAQLVDSAAAHTVRFSGTVASLSTTRPVSTADIRLVFIDSVHADGSSPNPLREVFVDTTKSRVGLTDSAGTFAIRNVVPGHYMITVRRIGFEPFDGLLTIDTATVEMELALTQIFAVLPRVTITADAVNHVIEKLDRVGFISRSHMGTSGTFIDRKEILRRKQVHVTDVLETYGIHRDALITLDRMPSDWDMLQDYPMDLVIGIEIYRRRGSIPTEFDMTRRGALSMGSGGNGGIAAPMVLVWTFVP